MAKTPGDRLIFTHERPDAAARGAKFAAGILFGGTLFSLGMAWVAWSAAPRTPGAWASLVVFGGFGLLGLGSGVAQWRSIGGRAWELDAEGITRHGSRGEPRRLAWRDVERVRWTGAGVRLTGRGESVTLDWNQLAKERQPEARRALYRALQDDFDLPDPDAPPGRSRWRTLVEATIYGLWMLAAQWAGVVLTLRLLRAALPAIARVAGPVLRDRTVLMYLALAFWMTAYLVLIAPLIIWQRRRVWYDRRIGRPGAMGA